jgi:hypothetical protein
MEVIAKALTRDGFVASAHGLKDFAMLITRCR